MYRIKTGIGFLLVILLVTISCSSNPVGTTTTTHNSGEYNNEELTNSFIDITGKLFQEDMAGYTSSTSLANSTLRHFNGECYSIKLENTSGNHYYLGEMDPDNGDILLISKIDNVEIHNSTPSVSSSSIIASKQKMVEEFLGSQANVDKSEALISSCLKKDIIEITPNDTIVDDVDASAFAGFEIKISDGSSYVLEYKVDDESLVNFIYYCKGRGL